VDREHVAVHPILAGRIADDLEQAIAGGVQTFERSVLLAAGRPRSLDRFTRFANELSRLAFNDVLKRRERQVFCRHWLDLEAHPRCRKRTCHIAEADEPTFELDLHFAHTQIGPRGRPWQEHIGRVRVDLFVVHEGGAVLPDD
jgi:hypothetical protein